MTVRVVANFIGKEGEDHSGEDFECMFNPVGSGNYCNNLDRQT